MPSSRALWQICKNLHAASLDKEEPGERLTPPLRWLERPPLRMLIHPLPTTLLLALFTERPG
jgi:hypothetical protein